MAPTSILPKGSKIEEQYRDAYTAWKQSETPETTGALLKAVSPIIDTGLKNYSSGIQTSPVLRGKAKRLALDSLKTYDPTRASLRIHLLSNMQRLRRLSVQERQLISMPEQVAIDRSRLRTTEKELYDKFSRTPSDAELADYMSISMPRIAKVRRAGRVFPESAFTLITEEGQIRDPVASPLGKQDNSWVEAVYLDLEPINQIILERAAGLHGHEVTPMRRIAKDLKISPAAVSQRLTKIQQLIDAG